MAGAVNTSLAILASVQSIASTPSGSLVSIVTKDEIAEVRDTKPPNRW